MKELVMNKTRLKDSNIDSTWVVIAAYNEDSVVGTVVTDLMEYGLKVVVVDDGSEDLTSKVSQDAGAAVILHPFNLGQGAALQTGIEFALRRSAKFIVTFDADGQHLASDVPLLISSLVKADVDIACGSRFLGRTVNLSKARRVVLKSATLFTFLISGIRMSDAHNGLRAMTRSCAMRIRIRQNRMAHASEIISEITRLKLSYIEVPVTIRYSPYSLQKGQRLTNSINIVLDLIMRRLYR